MSKPSWAEWPYEVARVGKRWGLFRVPPFLSRNRGGKCDDSEEPITVSWHATEAEATKAQYELTYNGKLAARMEKRERESWRGD